MFGPFVDGHSLSDEEALSDEELLMETSLKESSLSVGVSLNDSSLEDFSLEESSDPSLVQNPGPVPSSSSKLLRSNLTDHTALAVSEKSSLVTTPFAAPLSCLATLS
jgi:hypothetical protein